MKTVDIKTLANYENQYIALPEDNSKVLAAAKSIRELEQKLINLKISNAAIRYIGPLSKFLATLCQQSPMITCRILK